jgi:hypothetical protein
MASGSKTTDVEVPSNDDTIIFATHEQDLDVVELS